MVYVVRSWPRLSQTFVLDEILGMQRLGRCVRIVALDRSDEELVQPELAQLREPVHFLLPEGAGSSVRAHVRIAVRSPRRYARAAWCAVRDRGADRGYHVASSVRCLTLAVRLAQHVRAGGHKRAAHVHAHFAHDPAAVAHLTHLLTGVPWSFTAHARDLFQVPAPILAARVRSARFAVTCSSSGAEHLRALAPDVHDRVQLVHHGVDVDTFRPSPARATSDGVPLIVSVARLVPKKGLDDLLDACRLLVDRGHRFRCVIYGSGPLHDVLSTRAATHGLADVVTLAGERTREQLRQLLAAADVFALTPYVTADGDRDGIPNVIVEAMACGLPVLATSTGGVPELVVDGINGLLVPARDVNAIADGLEQLLVDGTLRARLGAAARRTVVDGFDARSGLVALAAMFPGGRS